jgi:hypothetical protein
MAKLRLAASVHAGSGHQVHNGLDLAALAAVAHRLDEPAPPLPYRINNAMRNPELHEQIRQFIDMQPPVHTCIQEYAEISGEAESPDMCRRSAHLDGPSVSDGSGEVCVTCRGPRLVCSDPANWDDD